MPKARGSGNIASIPAPSGTTSPASIDQQEMADRLTNRLSEIRTVDVPVYSNSRRRMENTRVVFNPATPDVVEVQSGSGVTHRVNYNTDRCTCQHHRVRGARCRHIAAAHQAVGRIAADRTDPQVATRQTADTAGVDSAISDRQQVDRIEEETRQNIQQITEDDGFFFTDNDTAFEETLQRVRNERMPYEYENVLNGSRNTFGLEIEFVGGNPNAIARELYNLGICSTPYQDRYHSTGMAGRWRLESDGSVSDSNGGGELVSPILTDTPETWRTLETICEVARRHGARIDSRCGGHVHMGMEPLDTARQRWRRFFRAIGGFEDVIYRLAGGSMGRIRGGYSRYARPFRERAAHGERSRGEMNDITDVQRLASTVSQGDRYYGINLTNIPDSRRPNTVEFRYFNSSLDPSQLQANVRMANAIMTAAENARTRDPNLSDNMRRRGEMLRDQPISSNSRADHSAIRQFVDIMFPRRSDQEHIISVYARNQWA